MVLWSRFHASSAGDVGKIPNQGTQLLLMRVKEESEKAGLKFNIQKTKIMASSPIISWQRDGERMDTMTDFIFLDSKITADGDYSHEVKRHFLLGPSTQSYVFSSSHVQM